MIFDRMHRNGEPADRAGPPTAGVIAEKNFRRKIPHWESVKNINKNKYLLVCLMGA
jgi:hypothetical protein